MVRAKKHLGQHFLTDKNIAEKIVKSLSDSNLPVLEIGPGTGVLTAFLVLMPFPFQVIEIDSESVAYLHQAFPELVVHEADFLHWNPENHFENEFRIIGNFPYNISSQILFRVLGLRHRIPEITGMFQKEVAERIATGPGSKQYGILSVLCQAFYTIDYLFTVPPQVFNPPPKVKSGVLRLQRKADYSLDCDEALFFKIVKAGFNQRRKTLKNALHDFCFIPTPDLAHWLTRRAEQLSVNEFVAITKQVRR
ncbi:MAG: 16S rRNA (adenine(1518)-N(6)/adenine(1519)-N(6))-dimethyltransferase RsmA [Bacteroidia bacterium]|nr:16S rRNA (adenine(1518)-N(6)/adenine(1519)-N(6))-dimethyltransferase RsmA [Bacteroidia bacterium]